MAKLRILALVCLLALGGCSYSYEVEAVTIDGRLAFAPAREARGRAKCVTRVQVLPVDYTRSQEGETQEAWAQRTYAWIDSGGYDGCRDRFPVFYGAALTGYDEQLAAIGEVEAKPLRVGVVYEVMITAGSTGYGSGRFRLLPDGRVENLPRASVDEPQRVTP